MNELVESVFNGASSVVNGAQSILAGAQATFTTYDRLQQQQQQQQAPSWSASRRDVAIPNQPMYQQPVYQPPQYPWAQPGYSGYGFGIQQSYNAGYPGITNPSYGIAYGQTIQPQTPQSAASLINSGGLYNIWQ